MGHADAAGVSGQNGDVSKCLVADGQISRDHPTNDLGKENFSLFAGVSGGAHGVIEDGPHRRSEAPEVHRDQRSWVEDLGVQAVMRLKAILHSHHVAALGDAIEVVAADVTHPSSDGLIADECVGESKPDEGVGAHADEVRRQGSERFCTVQIVSIGHSERGRMIDQMLGGEDSVDGTHRTLLDGEVDIDRLRPDQGHMVLNEGSSIRVDHKDDLVESCVDCVASDQINDGFAVGTNRSEGLDAAKAACATSGEDNK